VTSDLVKSVLSQKSAHNVAVNSFSNINFANRLFKMLTKFHELIKKKRAFDAQKQEKNKDLIFIINIDEDLKYISNASDDDINDNEHDK
jgi:hypothetical protein